MYTAFASFRRRIEVRNSEGLIQRAGLKSVLYALFFCPGIPFYMVVPPIVDINDLYCIGDTRISVVAK